VPGAKVITSVFEASVPEVDVGVVPLVVYRMLPFGRSVFNPSLRMPSEPMWYVPELGAIFGGDVVPDGVGVGVGVGVGLGVGVEVGVGLGVGFGVGVGVGVEATAVYETSLE
jgi:hypothetical protein